MQLFYVAEVKRLMNTLLKDSLFDNYEARGVVLRAFTGFEVDCVADAQDDGIKTKYCLWGEIKPVIFNLIKGRKAPRFLKASVCLSGDAAKNIDENAAALHMTFTYDNGIVSVLTGASQIKFTLDKSVDAAWDRFVSQLFSENGFEMLDEPVRPNNSNKNENINNINT